MFQARADISAPCRRVGRSVSALLFFARDILERDRSISSSFSDIDDSELRGRLLERELPFNLVVNGVR